MADFSISTQRLLQGALWAARQTPPAADDIAAKTTNQREAGQLWPLPHLHFCPAFTASLQLTLIPLRLEVTWGRRPQQASQSAVRQADRRAATTPPITATVLRMNSSVRCLDSNHFSKVLFPLNAWCQHPFRPEGALITGLQISPTMA